MSETRHADKKERGHEPDDTPRTNAMLRELASSRPGDRLDPVSLCRQLERELAEAHEEYARDMAEAVAAIKEAESTSSSAGRTTALEMMEQINAMLDDVKAGRFHVLDGKLRQLRETPLTIALSASRKTADPLNLLFNVYCMANQERDAEWEAQWRELVQAIEVELVRNGRQMPTHGGDFAAALDRLDGGKDG